MALHELLLLILSIVGAVSISHLDCPALKEKDVKHFDIALPDNLGVPPQQTSYVCQQFKVRGYCDLYLFMLYIYYEVAKGL